MIFLSQMDYTLDLIFNEYSELAFNIIETKLKYL